MGTSLLLKSGCWAFCVLLSSWPESEELAYYGWISSLTSLLACSGGRETDFFWWSEGSSMLLLSCML